jgi:hypothetical protein
VVSNAIELASRLECNLHILYLLRPQLFPGLFQQARKKRIALLQQELQPKLKAGLLMHAIYSEGQPYNEIKSYLFSNDVDLVYLPDIPETQWPFSPLFQSERLALESNCAVISGQALGEWEHCDKIVLPVEQNVPINSLRTGVYLAQHFNATIHLLASREQKDEKGQSLSRAYHLLKSNTDVPVVCDTFEGKRFQESVLSYAKKIQAGLIVSNMAYRKQPGFLGRFLSREFALNRSVPVMMVE